jgi:SAM-dependent methyltransferase
MSHPAADSTERFSNRVDAYRAGRPTYPAAVVAHLRAIGALPPGGVVADVGVGTGLSAEPFLAAGHPVVGVEPNAPMRAAGAADLARFGAAYRAVDGTAAATGLPDGGVDLVIAAQAFHWFDPAAFRAESRRILRPGGWAALLWNDRDLTGSPFLVAYEALMVNYGAGYLAIRYRHQGTGAIAEYFGGMLPVPAEFPHARKMDWAALAAQVGSASYLPAPGAPRHDDMLADLRALFEREARDGAVDMRYTCRVHAAPL